MECFDWHTIETSEIRGGVVYADGSCRGGTNPGYMGWGIHGYLYNDVEPKKSVVVNGMIVKDIGYKPASEDGVPVSPVIYIDGYGSSDSPETNNVAEMLAVLNALRLVFSNNLTKLLILSDSRYTVDGLMEWCPSWKKYGWVKRDTSALMNVELWKEMYALLCAIREEGVIISLEWVKGHSLLLGNERADSLANIGANASMCKETKSVVLYTEPQHYWVPVKVIHPFITFKQIYFNSLHTHNNRGEYYQASLGTGNEIPGKRHPGASLSVIRLYEPCEVIETVKQIQHLKSGSQNAIMVILLSEALNNSTYKDLITIGEHTLVKDRRNLNLLYTDKTPVTIEANPVGLSLRVIDSFNYLEEILDSFTNRKPEIQFHDITDKFYTRSAKGKVTLNPEIDNNMKNMNIEISEHHNDKDCKLRFLLVFGLDIVVRNTLKKIETMEPQIYLVSWKCSDRTLRYGTLIKTDTDIGIWSNYYSNLIIV